MRMSFSPAFLWEKWYKNITFLTRKFTGLCMDSLATSCCITSNKTQPSCHSCQMKQQPDKLRAWCSCINVSAPQGAAHPPLCSPYTKCFSDSISNAFCHTQHTAVTHREWPTDPLLRAQRASPSCPTVCSAHSVQHQNLHFQMDAGRNRERDWADPSNNYVSRTLKEIFSNMSLTNDQNVITVRRQMLFLYYRAQTGTIFPLLQNKMTSQVRAQCLLHAMT